MFVLINRVMNTNLVFGIGVGLFLLIILWASAALICLVSYRTDKKVGFIAVVVVLALTIILVKVPRTPEIPEFREEKVIFTLSG